ncbi:MAG TPA: hypothetical protein VI542_16450 [Candidatus Tectomicrobia bacterium]
MDEDAPPQAVFTFSDTTRTATAPDVLGLWAAVQAAPAAAVSFDAATVASPAMPLWHVDLAADANLAATSLASGEAHVRASQEALALAEERLKAFVAARTTAPAFAISSAAVPSALPEAELLVWLQDTQEGAVSFGLGDWLHGGWEETTEQFQAFVNRLLQSLAHYTAVETAVQGQLLGRTTVSWTGDMDTVWQPGLDPTSAMLHQRALALALASRDTWMRMVVVVARGAITLSVLLTTPGGAILALPAAWKFVQQVLSELEKYPQNL